LKQSCTWTPALVPAFIFLLLLSACAGPPTRPSAEAEALWDARLARLAGINTWDVRGRLAVRAPEGGGQATLRWRRQNDRQEIDLTGPLGKQLLKLFEDGQGARMRDAQQREFAAADAQALLWQATGWYVPLAGLRHWIIGVPAPGPAQARELDHQGRLARLRQLDWDVRFQDYMRVDGIDLPRRIVLRYLAPLGAGETAGEFELRLLVQAWDLTRP
jgi:outer membrane lipoprotein LolB